MSSIQKVAVLGAGVIGASWCSLFLAADLEVSVYDPGEDAEQKLGEYVNNAWSTLVDLGLTARSTPPSWTFYSSAADAVRGADFIQESVPERLDIKHALYAEVEPHLNEKAIVSSSASGLMVREMQEGWKNPARFMLGHPFNPPHLIPLVELLVNERTDDDVMETAEAFYQHVGKETIRVNREVPAHVANRLQAALWREAIHLVEAGVASVEDIDKAVWAGPGIRWAAMGPHMLFNLAAGPGGMNEFCNRYGDSFHRWWEDLGDVDLDGSAPDMLAGGIADASDGKSLETLAKERDALIVAMLKSTRSLRSS